MEKCVKMLKDTRSPPSIDDYRIQRQRC